MNTQDDPAGVASPPHDTSPDITVAAVVATAAMSLEGRQQAQVSSTTPMVARTKPLRTNCANCATPLIGRYCHDCSQSSAPTSMSVSGALRDYVYMMFKVDSKFVHTLKLLVLSPGKLSLDHHNGIIVPYTPPLRLLLVISFSVFIIFALADLKLLQTKVEYAPDARITRDADGMVSLHGVTEDMLGVSRTLPAPKPPPGFMTSLDLESAKQNDWFDDKQLRFWRATATGDPLRDIWAKGLPLLYLAISPLFAGFLALLYRSAGYTFADHLVFAIHVHSFGLLVLLLPGLFVYVWPAGADLMIETALFSVYIIVSCRTFYRSSWLAAFIKGIILLAVDMALTVGAAVAIILGVMAMT